MNKYLHTVASVGFLFTLNYDARNHELKIYLWLLCLCVKVSRLLHFVSKEIKVAQQTDEILIKRHDHLL